MPVPTDGIQIDNFIFHVVHHGEDEPILMDETPIDGFELFFKRRIAEVLDGNKFDFIENSTFRNQMQEIDTRPRTFLTISKEIATVFHSHQDNRIKPGVMILIKARINSIRKYILIKYDHEEVIFYTKKGNKAVLSEISNTFSKSKEALQKSVVVDLNGTIPYAVVIDKSERQHVTQFFKNFLGIKRVYDTEKLTQKVKESYQNVVRQFKGALPKEYTSQSSLNFYNTVQNTKAFESDSFLRSIFGSHYTEQMDSVFKRELRRNDVEGEVFDFNKKIPRPKQQKYRTFEGVYIQFPSEANDTVKIVNENDKTIVTITTTKLVDES